MFLSILIDYTHGMLVEKYRAKDALARWFVAESVIFNLLLLGFFKYWDFFALNLSRIPGIAIPALGIPLPIGISFFTFQTMSYTIDVYRQDAPVQRNIVSFGAFVTMFPQLIAGPIVKYKAVAAELNSRGHTLEGFARGALRFTVGLAKKVLLANYRISVNALEPHLFDDDGCRRLDGAFGLWVPDLFRLFRLFRHGHRHGTDVRFPVPGEF
jgi:alginate O-acetyltransferase complex protein AlgI